uniref:Uncharacterized protein n=1 Tax=Romanomermis culicivorax TaxID=13658 RepID=A0A915HWE1_ROMCU
MDILRKMINQMLPETRKEQIQQICSTRWVDRHRTLVSFGELFLPITATLQQLSETDKDRITKDLINGITTFDSIFSLNVSIKVAGILKHLAITSCTESMDLIMAHKEICLTSTLIKEAIDETKFSKLYVKSMIDDMGITVAFPNREKRLCKDTLNSQSSVKEYY